MSTPSQNDRIEIWRYTYARCSLVDAREAAKILLSNSGLQDEIKEAIVCQIVISYARPFTRWQVTESNRIVPLESNLVPAQFKALHDEHLEMRDRTIGHKDAMAFPSTPLNRVIVRVDTLGFDLHTVSHYTMLPDGLKRTVELCDILIKECLTKLSPFAAHIAGTKPGVYVLSTENNPKEWLVKKG